MPSRVISIYPYLIIISFFYQLCRAINSPDSYSSTHKNDNSHWDNRKNALIPKTQLIGKGSNATHTDFGFNGFPVDLSVEISKSSYHRSWEKVMRSLVSICPQGYPWSHVLSRGWVSVVWGLFQVMGLVSLVPGPFQVYMSRGMGKSGEVGISKGWSGAHSLQTRDQVGTDPH